MQTKVKKTIEMKKVRFSRKLMQNSLFWSCCFFCFPFSCPKKAIMQSKWVIDIWVFSKSCQTNSWSSSLLFQPSPTPTLQGWNFLLMAQCKRPLSYGKLTLKMSMRDRGRKLQTRNAGHVCTFLQNLESLHCQDTFLFTDARETDYY